jgi:hypothetical protein
MDWSPFVLLLLFALIMLALRTLSDIPTRGTTLLSLNLRWIRYYTPYNRQVLPNVGIRWGWTTSLPLKMTCKTMKIKQRIWNETTRTSQLGLLIDPKSDSSVSKIVQQLPRWTEALQQRKLYSTPPRGTNDAIVWE